MDADERRAAHYEACERHREALQHPIEVRRNDVDGWVARKPDAVTQPGEFARWLSSQPESEPVPELRPVPPPAPTLTVAEVKRMIRESEQRNADKLAERDQFWHDVIGGLINEVRRGLRNEIQEQVGLLRADIEVEKRAVERKHGRGEIVDLTPVPMWGQRRAG